MSLFGWTLVRNDELKELHKAYVCQQTTIRCRDWFSGWKDLDIIWDYILSETYFGDISSARDKYAKARNTDAYGQELSETPDS